MIWPQFFSLAVFSVAFIPSGASFVYAKPAFEGRAPGISFIFPLGTFPY